MNTPEQGEFAKTLDAMVADLTARGVNRRFLRPLMYRVLWGLGYTITPPLFQPWSQVFLTAAVPLTALMLLAKWLFSSTISVVFVLLVALGLAAALATFYGRQREKHDLPDWAEYVGTLSRTKPGGKKRKRRDRKG